MKRKMDKSRILWTALILGLPLIVGIGRLSPNISAIVDTVNRPLQLVSIENEQIQDLDSPDIDTQCRSNEAPSESCPANSISETDSTHMQ